MEKIAIVFECKKINAWKRKDNNCIILLGVFVFGLTVGIGTLLKIGAGHFFRKYAQQIHHIAKADICAVAAVVVHFTQQAVHGIIGDIGH